MLFHNAELFIGQAAGTEQNRIGNGNLADVRIYNYAVSADDVKTIMDGGTLTSIDIPVIERYKPTVYGLDGIRRDAPQKGINIVDRKKVVR